MYILFVVKNENLYVFVYNSIELIQLVLDKSRAKEILLNIEVHIPLYMKYI